MKWYKRFFDFMNWIRYCDNCETKLKKEKTSCWAIKIAKCSNCDEEYTFTNYGGMRA